MAILRTRAYLLRAFAFGERSRIASLFGLSSGKLRVVAKGYRDPKSRFAGALEPFRLIEVVYYHRVGRELQIAAEADVLSHHEGVEADIVRYSYACAALELMERILPDEEPAPALFRLLDRTLGVLSEASGARAALVFRGFQARTCAEAGFLPALESCAVCEGTAPANRLFSARAGGFVCESCSRTDEGAEAISPESAGLFRFLLRAEPDEVARAYNRELRPAALEVAGLIERFQTAHIEGYRGLRSLQALGRLTRTPGAAGRDGPQAPET
jgi:DNA repair protein RecO (recombination protein O)